MRSTITDIRDNTAERNIHEYPHQMYDVEALRRTVPILATDVRGKPLVYLDNAATTQKPLAVIEAESRYYQTGNANVHRGVHLLSQRATEAYEEARETLRGFINARSLREIVFTRGTTEAINLVAHSWGLANLAPGDEILLTHMEHHSNIVPWQILAETTGAKLIVTPVNHWGELDMQAFADLLGPRTKIAAVTHVSNTLGTINPLKEMTELAHEKGAVVLADGAQAVPHMAVDVQDLDVDFYAFSGHKMYGPMGIGVLYGKEHLLRDMPPYQSGGDMILSVDFDKTTYNGLPYRFEAGTPNVAGAVGLAAAVDVLQDIGLDAIETWEQDLLTYATGMLHTVPGLEIIGQAMEKTAVISFTLEGIHPHDAGTILDREGVAVRTGHHCTQPLMKRFGITGTTRMSLGMYSTAQEIDALVRALHKTLEVFSS